MIFATHGAKLATLTLLEERACWVATKRVVNQMITMVNSLTCTTLRPQCLQERSTIALRCCCVLIAHCTFCTTTPNELRLLADAAQPDFFVVFTAFFATGTLKFGFSEIGLMGWATR